MHTCGLSQAKTTKRHSPVKCKLHLPTHPLPKVQLYIVVKCRQIYKVKNKNKSVFTEMYFVHSTHAPA